MEDEERERKIQAGKDKLAAFQRKRGRKKKKKPEGDAAGVSDTSSLAGLSDVSFTDQSDMSSMSCDESDTGSMLGEDEDSGSMRLVSLATTQGKLSRASGRVVELEEMLMGKQAALDHLIEENQQLKQTKLQASNQTSTPSPTHSLGSQSTVDRETDSDSEGTYKQKWEEFQGAIRQRDDVIKQLSSNLQAVTENRDTLQAEYTTQAEQLAQQVHTLQLQLQQAGEWLKTQTGPHGISVQALLEAKNEILALQQAAKHKDSQISALKEATTQRDTQLAAYVGALQQRDDAIQQLAERCQIATQQLEALANTNAELQAQISSPSVEDTDKVSLKDIQQKENELQATLEKYSKTQQELQQLTDSKSSLEKEIEALQRTLSLKDQSMQQMALQLSDMMQASQSHEDDRVEDRNLGQSLAELQALRKSLEQRDSENAALKGSVAEKEQEVTALRSSLTQKEQSLQQLTLHLADGNQWESQVARLREELEHKDQHVISLDQSLEHQKTLLNQVTNDLHAVSQQLQGKEEALQQEVSDLHDKISQKDKSLQDLAGQLMEMSSLVSTLEIENKSYKENENHLKLLQEELQKSQPDFDSLKDSFKKKDMSLTQMTNLVTDMRLQLEDVQKQNAELCEHSAQLTQLKAELADMQETVQVKDQSMQQMAGDMKAYRTQLAQLKQQNEQVQADMAQAGTDLNQQREVLLRDMEGKQAALQEQYEQLLAEKQHMEQSQEALLSSKDRSISDLQSQLQHTAGMEQKLLEIKTVCEEREKEVEYLKDTVQQKDAVLEQFQGKLSELESVVSQLQNEKDSLSAGIGSLQKQNDSLNGEIELVQKEKEELLQRVSTMTSSSDAEHGETVAALQAHISQLMEDMSQQEAVLDRLRQDLSQKEDTLGSLGDQLMEREKSIGKLSEQLGQMSEAVELLNVENKQLKDSHNKLLLSSGGQEESECRPVGREPSAGDIDSICEEANPCLSEPQLRGHVEGVVDNTHSQSGVVEPQQAPLTASVPEVTSQVTPDLDTQSGDDLTSHVSHSDYIVLQEKVSSLESELQSYRNVKSILPDTNSELPNSNMSDSETNYVDDKCAIESHESDIAELRLQVQSQQTELEMLHSQVASLGQQAELVKAENMSVISELEHVKDALQQKAQELEQQNEKVDLVNAELVSKLNDLNTQSVELQTAQMQLQVASAESDTLRIQLEQTSNELKAKTEDLQTLNHELEQSRAEVERVKSELNEQLSTLNHELEQSRAEVESVKSELQAELSETLDELQSKTEALDSLTSEQNSSSIEAQEQLEKAGKDLEARIEELGIVKEQVANLENQIENISCDLREKEQEVELLQTENLKLQDSENLMSEAKCDLEKQLSELSEKMSLSERAHTEQQCDIVTLNTKLKEITSERDELELRINGQFSSDSDTPNELESNLTDQILRLQEELSEKQTELDRVILERDELQTEVDSELHHNGPTQFNASPSKVSDVRSASHDDAILEHLTLKLSEVTQKLADVTMERDSLAAGAKDVMRIQEELLHTQEQLQEVQDKQSELENQTPAPAAPTDMIPSSAVQELSERLQQYYAGYQQKEAEVVQLHEVIRQMSEQLTLASQHITQLQAHQNSTETTHPVGRPDDDQEMQAQTESTQPHTLAADVTENQSQAIHAIVAAPSEPIQAEFMQPLSQGTGSPGNPLATADALSNEQIQAESTLPLTQDVGSSSDSIAKVDAVPGEQLKTETVLRLTQDAGSQSTAAERDLPPVDSPPIDSLSSEQIQAETSQPLHQAALDPASVALLSSDDHSQSGGLSEGRTAEQPPEEFVIQMNDLQDKITQKHEECVSLQGTLDEISRELLESKEKVEILEEQLRKASTNEQSEISKLQESLDLKAAELNETNQKNSDLEDHAKQVTEHLQSSEEKVNLLEGQVTQVTEEMRESCDKVLQLEAELRRLQEEDNKKSEASQDYASQVGALQNALEMKQQELLQFHEAVRQMTEQMAVAGQRLTALSEENADLKSQSSVHQQRKAKFEKEMAVFEKLKADYGRLEEKVQQAEEAKELDTDIEQSKSYMTKLEDELVILQTQNTEYEKSVQELKAKDEENLATIEKLKGRDAETGQVVQQLMQDIERLRRENSVSMSTPVTVASAVDTVSPEHQQELAALRENSVSLEVHQQELDSLRAELDELHGTQIVMMKQQVVAQHEELQEQLKTQLQHAVQERSASDSQRAQLQAQYNAMMAEKDQALHSLQQDKQNLEAAVKELREQHEVLEQKTASSGDDVKALMDKLEQENMEYKAELRVMASKLEAAERENEEVKAELKETKITLYDYESQNPDVAVYRKKLQELHATLKVTWIENESLKTQVGALKSQLGMEEPPPEGATGGSPEGATGGSATQNGGMVTLGNPAVALRKQLDRQEAEYTEKVESLQRDLENLKARMKELQINRDSLIAKHEHDIRIREQDHSATEKELNRQLGVLQSQVNILQSRCQQAVARSQQIQEERDAMEKKYSEGITQMKEQHAEALAQLNVQLSQGVRKVYIPVKTDGKSEDPQLREMKTQLENLTSERDRLVWERDQATTERHELLVQREILMAEKQQLVADRDGAFADRLQEEQVSRDSMQQYSELSSEQHSAMEKLAQMHTHNAELIDKLSAALNEIEEKSAKLDILTQDQDDLQKQIECVVREKSEVVDENTRLSAMVNELDEYKGNTDAIHGQKTRELRMKVSELEHRVEQLQEEERFRLEEVTLSHEEVVMQLKAEIEHLHSTGTQLIKAESASADLNAVSANADNDSYHTKQSQAGDVETLGQPKATGPLEQQLQEAMLELQILKQTSEQKQQSYEQEITDLRKQLDAHKSMSAAEADEVKQPVGKGKGKKQQKHGAGAKPSKTSASTPDVDKRVEQLQKQLEVAQAELLILKSDDKPNIKGKKNAKTNLGAKANKSEEVTDLRKQLESAKAEIASLKKKLAPSNKATSARQGNTDKKEDLGEVEKLRSEITGLKQQLADARGRGLSAQEESSATQANEVSVKPGPAPQPSVKRKDAKQSTGRSPLQPGGDNRVALQKEVSELKKQLEKAQAELRSLRVSEASGKGKKAGKHKGQKASPTDDLQQRLEKANAEIGTLKESAVVAAKDKASLESEAATLREDVKDLTAQVQQLQQLEPFTGSPDDAVAQMQKLRAEMQRMEKEKDEILEEKRSLQRDNERYLEKLEEAGDEVDRMQASLNKAGGEDVQVQLREAEEDRDQLRLVLDQLEADNVHLQERLQDLTTGDFKGELSILSSELQQERQTREQLEAEKAELLARLEAPIRMSLDSLPDEFQVSSPEELQKLIEELQQERDMYQEQSASHAEKAKSLLEELNALRGVKEAEVYALNQELGALRAELHLATAEVQRRVSQEQDKHLTMDLDLPPSGGDFVLESPRPENADKLFADMVSSVDSSDGAFVAEVQKTRVTHTQHTMITRSQRSLTFSSGSFVAEDMDDEQVESLYMDKEKVKEILLEYEQKITTMKDNYERRISEAEVQLQSINTHQENDDLEESREEALQDLKFEHDKEMRTLRIELECDRDKAVRELKEQHQYDVQQRLEAQKAEHDRRFVEELQRVRRELKAQARLDSEDLADRAGDLDFELSSDGHTASDPELDDDHRLERQVFRLRKENQELAESRDALLHQIDTSNSHQLELQDRVDNLSLRLEQLGEQVPESSISMYTDVESITVPDSANELPSVSERFDPYDASMAESLADYSESDLRAQIIVLQRENQKLHQHIDNQHLSTLQDVQGELADLQSKYSHLVEENNSLTARFQSEGSEYGSDFALSPVHEAPTSEWKVKYDSLKRENETLHSRLETALRSGQTTIRSQTVETIRSRYETIVEENEILRAKLGSYGLPTEGTAEEDLPLDVNARFDKALRENETLRNKLDSYSMSSSSERDEDWRTQFNSVLTDWEKVVASLEEAGLQQPEGFTQGLDELQAMYDVVIKERDGLLVRINTVMENAEKDFKKLQQKCTEAESEITRLKEKLKRAGDKTNRDKTRLKARFVAASKEIAALKEKLGESAGPAVSVDTDPDSSESQGRHSDAYESTSNEDKYISLLEENRTLKAEIYQLRSNSEKTSQEIPETGDHDEEDINVKYTAACQEIEQLRHRLDQVSTDMQEEISGYQAEADALVEKSEIIGHAIEDDVHAAQTRISQLQTQCASALERECSVTESVEFTDFHDEDNDSDTSADSLNLEMETDYEVLVVEYERLKAQGPAEVQRAYESVVGRHRLENGGRVLPKDTHKKRKDRGGPRRRGKTHSGQTTSTTPKESKLSTVTKSLENLQGQEKAKLTVSLDRIRVATNTRQEFPLVNHASGHASDGLGAMEGEEHLQEWQMVATEGGRQVSEQPDTGGQFISETDWQESDASALESSSEWSLPDKDEIDQQIDELVAFIPDNDKRQDMKVELLDLCRKYCCVMAENESLKLQLREKNEHLEKLRSECEEGQTDKALGDIMGASWDSVPEFHDLMKSQSRGSLKDLAEYDSGGKSIEKLNSHIKELKRAVILLKHDNETLKRENVNLSSTFESQTAKASWEITLMRSSYEEEIEELKHSQSDLSTESGKIKETLEDLKCQFEAVCRENEQLAEIELELRKELEEATSNVQSLFQEKEHLEADLADKAHLLCELQGIDNFTLSSPEDGVGGPGQPGGSTGGSSVASGDGPGDSSGGGGKDDDACSDSSGGMGGSTGGDGGDFNGSVDLVKQDTGLEKTWEELKEENEELRKRLRAKCVELHLLQKKTRNHDEMVQDNKKLTAELSNHKEELQNLKAKHKAILKDNESLELKLNAAVLRSGQELEEVRRRQEALEAENRGLMERLDRDIVRAERDVAQLKQKCHAITQEKDELEDEYKAAREKMDKEMSHLQDIYDELDRENEMLKAHINAAKQSAEKEVTEARTSVEGMAIEQMSMEADHKRIRQKNRHEIDVLKSQLEAALKEKHEKKQLYEDIKSQFDNVKHDLQRTCNKLQEDNDNLKSELKDISKKYEEDSRTREDAVKRLEESMKNLRGLESYHSEVKTVWEEEKLELESKLSGLDEDYRDLSKTNEELKSVKATLSQELEDLQAWSELMERNKQELEGTLEMDNKGLKQSLKETMNSLNIEIKARETAAQEKQELERKLEGLQKKYQILEGVYEDLQKGRSTEVDWFRKELDVLQVRYEESVSTSNKFEEQAETANQTLIQLKDSMQMVQQTKDNMAGEIEILKSKVKRLEERQVDLSAERDDVTQEREDTAKELKELQNRYREKEKLLDNLKYEMNTTIDALNKELFELKQNYSKLNQEHEDVVDEKNAIKRDFTFLQEKYEAIESKRWEMEDAASAKDGLKVRLEELECSYNGVMKENDELMATSKELQQKLDSITHRYEVIDEEKEQAVSAKRAISLEMDGLMERMQKNQKDKEEMQGELFDLQTKYDALLNEMDDKEKEKGAGEREKDEEIRNLRRKNSTLEEQLKETAVAKEKVSCDLEEEQSKYSALEDMYEKTKQQFSADEQTLQAELEQLRVREVELMETEREGAILKTKAASLEATIERMGSVGEAAEAWHKEYLTLNDNHVKLMHENEALHKRIEKLAEYTENTLPLSSECRIGTNYSDLLEENSRLINEKIKLENEIMSSKIDRLEVDTVYAEVNELKSVKAQLEGKLKEQHALYKQEHQALEARVAELQDQLDDVAHTKTRLERELTMLKERRDVKEERVDASKYVDETKLKGEDAMEILMLQIAHLKRECDLYERHVRDLEKEVEVQYEQQQQTSTEHKEMVKVFTETRLELEIYRAKHRRDVNKIEEVMNRIEGHISGRSSPRTFLLSQTLLGQLSGRNSPSPLQRHSRSGSMCVEDESLNRANFIPEDSRYFQTVGDPMKPVDHSTPEDTNSRKGDHNVSIGSHGSHLSPSMIRRDTPARGRSPASSDSSGLEWPAGYRSVKEELEILHQRNQELTEERADLEARLKKQEDVVIELQKYADKGSDPDENRIAELFNHQLMLLRQQRDQLSDRIQEDRERDRRVLDLIHEKAVLEEHFKNERANLWRKLKEKENTEIELLDKITALEKHIKQQQKLEDLVYQKKQIEAEITQQKHIFEREMGSVEMQIHERGSYLRSERAHLVGAHSASPFRSASPVQLSRDFSPHSSQADYTSNPEETSSWLHDYEDRLASVKGHISDEQFDRLSRMKAVVEKRYRVAIGRLRQEMKADDEASSRHSSSSLLSRR